MTQGPDCYSLLNDVYLFGNNKPKLVDAHLPALNRLLGLENPSWQIDWDKLAGGTHRFTHVEKLPFGDKLSVLDHVMRKASRISGRWNLYVSGYDGSSEQLYIMAHQQFSGFRGPPALSSVMFEIVD